MTDTVNILKAARDLISKPENWAQGVYARDENGNGVSVYSDSAKCFCSVGALMRVSDGDVRLHTEAKKELLKFVPFGIADFNDTSSHKKVLSLFSKAITAAEEAER